ncbi:MFS transporter [Nocardia stercoris]|uniref:MFS transporter n=1 Tax=Nocardia stercoris TaxID=2483361 RepID=A0A3M2KWI1_9NOCA|nr:MFS transporter [Nocardia stercoris]RMI29947.1 MFS transporter [Nocardia stercoris]
MSECRSGAVTTFAPPDVGPQRSRWWGLAALTLSFLVVGLDSNILITALPTLATELKASTSALQWISTSYNLMWAGLLLPMGTLGDKVGRRRMLLTGLAVFGAGSIGAALVDTAGGLIAMRALMGAGAAVIMPLGMALLPVLFPADTDRRRAVTVTTVGAVVALPTGPLLAGWLLEHWSWGWIFLINVPVVVLTVIGVWLFVPESRDPANPRLDWLGALLSGAGIVAVTYAVIEGPDQGWDVRLLALLGAGSVLVAVFVDRQRRAESPLIDLRLFGNRLFTWGTVAFALISFAMSGVAFLLTPYLQLVQGNDAQGTGLRLLPQILAMLAGAGLGETFGTRIGVRYVIPLSMLIGAGGLSILTRVRADSGCGPVALGLTVFGVGLGLGLPLAADTVLKTLPGTRAGMGTALSRTLQSIGVVLGTAVLGSVLSAAYRTRLDGSGTGLPGAAATAARSNIAGAHAVAGGLPHLLGAAVTDAADHAYVHGMTTAILTAIGVLVVGAILTAVLLPGTDIAAAPQDSPGDD